MTDEQLVLIHLNFIKEQLNRALDFCTDDTVSESYKVGYCKGTLESVADIITDVIQLVGKEYPVP